jgi:hypothetical protein
MRSTECESDLSYLVSGLQVAPFLTSRQRGRSMNCIWFIHWPDVAVSQHQLLISNSYVQVMQGCEQTGVCRCGGSH